MYTLGIETSCDETSVAVLKNYRVLSNVTLSSLKEHAKFGGVIPEIASRAHLTNIDRVAAEALKQAKISWPQLDLISVTNQPGLAGALVVGLNFAKALALVLNKPLIGVNHLQSHLFAPFLGKNKFSFPLLGLVVSGGHSEIYYIKDFDDFKVVGRSLDDACGEVYDKIAREVALGYPGGPVIDRLFNLAYKNSFKFNCGRKNYDLSFSGIKTAVVYKAKELAKAKKLNRLAKVKLVSSFQAAVVETIVTTVVDAAVAFKVKNVVCGGGVMANSYLRQRLQANSSGINFLLAQQQYALDNAAMVAGLGFYLYNKKGKTSLLDLEVTAS